MMIKAVLLDLSGVIYQGPNALPGAAQAVARLRAAGLNLRFVTNTTRTTKKMILEHLRCLGVECTDCEVFTPAYAARMWLRKNNRTPYLLVHPDFKDEFQDFPDDGRHAVIVGDAGDAFNYATLNEAFGVLQQGAEFLALAENRSFKDADGHLSLDAGPFVKLLEFASQRTAILIGKPSQAFFEAALEGTKATLKQAVIVGDDAEADISGALQAGIGYGLLVRTGKYKPKDEFAFHPAPTEVVDDIAAAEKWILDRCT